MKLVCDCARFVGCLYLHLTVKCGILVIGTTCQLGNFATFKNKLMRKADTTSGGKPVGYNR